MEKLLVVEDHDDSRDMLSRRLRRKGYDVITASDGSEGVNRAIAERPDLIVMDLNLPILDGWQATERIRREQAPRRTPVIALTAHAMTHDREKAIEAGCDDFEAKPVEFDRLLAKIDSLLRRRPTVK